MELRCPHCNSSDLARYVQSGMGRSIRNTRRQIDTGCIDNGYRYHCWNCGIDLENLSDDPIAGNELDKASGDDIYMTE